MDIKSYLAKVGIDITDIMEEQLLTYYNMLVEKNKVMNLTAITEFEDVVIKHFADSVAIIHAMDISGMHKILDLGTGAGFPGMVLKIVMNQPEYTLLDSLNKRIQFLKEVSDSLDLQGIEGVHGRAEDFAKLPAFRESYDLCVSRAVANLATLSEYCIPFVKIGGYFIAYKAGDCEDEILAAANAVKTLGAEIESVVKYTLPDTDIERTFVVIAKKSKTSKMFPRKAGLPSKEPLN